MKRLIQENLRMFWRYKFTAILYFALLLVIISIVAASVRPKPEVAFLRGDPSLHYRLYDADQSPLSRTLSAHLAELYQADDVPPADQFNTQDPKNQTKIDMALYTGETHAIITIQEGFDASYASSANNDNDTNTVADAGASADADAETSTKASPAPSPASFLTLDFPENLPEAYGLQAELQRFLQMAGAVREKSVALGQDFSWDEGHLTELNEALQTHSELIPVADPQKLASTSRGGLDSTAYRFMGYTLMACVLSVLCYVQQAYRQGSVQARLRLAELSSAKQLLAQATAELIVALIFLVAMQGSLYLITNVLFPNPYLDPPEFTSILLIFIASLLLALNSIALSHLITELFPAKMMSGVITVFTLALAFLSGAFVPLRYLGETSRTLARFFPLYYYIEIIDGEAKTLGAYLPQLGILLLFAIFYFVLVLFIRRFRPQTNLLTVETESTL